MSKNKNQADTTRLIHTGHDPKSYHGIVNPPITRASTILYENLDAYEDPNTKYRYGRYGTPLTCAFTDSIIELEGGYNAIAAPSGQSAITTALLAFLESGDHLLMVDTAYPPARFFCDNVLTKMGIEVEYYDPLLGARIADKIKTNTAVIYMESPGSATFEIQDVPAMVKAAKARNPEIISICDNSYASGVLFKPLSHGVDVSILSCTKYINGQSDGMLGAAVARDETTYAKLKKSAVDLGVCAGTEETNLGLRGLKTLHIRIKEAGERALKIAQYLEGRPEVERVYYPALENDPNHALLKRDFNGANGILSILLKPAPRAAIVAFTDALTLFPIGSSWGGYESLTQPQYLAKCRTATGWTHEGAMLRLQIGLEDTQDLIDNLETAFEAFNRHCEEA
jgi:cystathionine beta-lyase